jgi:hypothetical protein
VPVAQRIAPHTRRLRVMMNGGIYEEHARRLVVGPFERDTGASVEVVPRLGSADHHSSRG